MTWAPKTATPKWVLAPETDPEQVYRLAADTGLPLNVLKILVNRNIDTVATIEQFLNPQLTDLKDPFELSGMRMGIDRVTVASSPTGGAPTRTVGESGAASSG